MHAEDDWGLIKEPRLLVPLQSGFLVGAKNGLFRFHSLDHAFERIGGEGSVNEIYVLKDRILTATDRGLFEYRPDKMAHPWTLIPPYRRSVRQVYRYSDQEFFWGTQDGMFYQYGNHVRQASSNIEIIRIIGKLNDDIVSVTETEVVLTSGETSAQIECPDKITSAVVIDDRLFVGTLSGLVLIDNGQAMPLRADLAVRDLQVFGPKLLAATHQGLHSVDITSAGLSKDSTLLQGDFTDLHTFNEGLIAIAGDRVCVLTSDAVLAHEIKGTKARVCIRDAEFGDKEFFTLDTGFLCRAHGSGGTVEWTFENVPSRVNDLYMDGTGAMVLATQNGLAKFVPQVSRVFQWSGGCMLVLVMVLALILWRRNRLRPVVFISYRRDDARDAVGRLRDHMLRQLGSASVRMDVHDIQKGVDFRHEISRNIAESTVVLVIIGPQWTTIKDSAGIVRLFAEVDYVRYEIETARATDKPIIPVLLGDVPHLKTTDLPESIEFLTFLDALNLRYDPDFDGDISKLMTSVVALSKGKIKTPQSTNPIKN